MHDSGKIYAIYRETTLILVLFYLMTISRPDACIDRVGIITNRAAGNGTFYQTGNKKTCRYRKAAGPVIRITE
jgi:hypothetical protein